MISGGGYEAQDAQHGSAGGERADAAIDVGRHEERRDGGPDARARAVKCGSESHAAAAGIDRIDRRVLLGHREIPREIQQAA